MARPDKAAAVAELTDLFRDSNAAVLTEYRGLTVAQLKKLRKALSGNATYAVVKNTLTAIAAKDAGLEGLDDALTGPSAIAFVSGDPVEAAKGLRDFAKANPALVIKGGVLDGRALTAADVTKLADLESREVLLAKAANVFKASLFQAAYLFTAPAAQAARTVDALRLKLRGVDRGRCLSHPAQALTEPPPGSAAPAAGHRSEGTATMAKLTTTELIDAFKELSLIELSEFVKAFEETFEVTAAAPVAVAAARRRRRRRCRGRGRGGEGLVRRRPRGRR